MDDRRWLAVVESVFLGKPVVHRPSSIAYRLCKVKGSIFLLILLNTDHKVCVYTRNWYTYPV